MNVGRETEIFLEMVRLDGLRILLLERDLLCCHSRNLSDLLLEASDAGFTCVLIDYLRESSLVYLHLTLVKAMLPYLLRDKIMPCDLHLLFSKIAAHIDHLHPVLQRRLDGVDVVGCSDEKHIRKIVIDIEIIVVESRILLRIKSFKQC